MPTTRLAPSPTGAMHLGNARTFLVNWALARQQGLRVLLRIEDLDGPRVKHGADELALQDLAWLGIDWDDDALYQRRDLRAYHQALSWLYRQELIYPCTCTRKEIELAQSAPHGDQAELRYPGTCRPEVRLSRARGLAVLDDGALRECGPATEWNGRELSDQAVAWRLRVPDAPIVFVDQYHGHQEFHIQRQVGDFVVATKADLPAYQLAVVVDDARQGVTQVVRGDDLLSSTGRQLWLYRLLGIDAVPSYLHVPLVLGPDGRRLAKRHGDTRLAWYRQQGVSAQRVVGLVAWWCGMVEHRQPMSPQAFMRDFDLGRLPQAPVTFLQEDHAWLLQRD